MWSAGRLWPLLFAGVRAGSLEFDMEALERNHVATTDELIRMMIAVSGSATGGSDATFFAHSLDQLFGGLSKRHSHEEPNGFWARHVYAYFDAARTTGHFETLAYEIRRATNDPATLEWLAQHGAEVERFRAWSATWSP